MRAPDFEIDVVVKPLFAVPVVIATTDEFPISMVLSAGTFKATAEVPVNGYWPDVAAVLPLMLAESPPMATPAPD